MCYTRHIVLQLSDCVTFVTRVTPVALYYTCNGVLHLSYNVLHTYSESCLVRTTAGPIELFELETLELDSPLGTKKII